MSVNPNDPRPQATIRTTSGTNGVEPRGPYVDQARTRRNPPDVAIPVNPAKSGSTTLGSTRPAYAADQEVEIDNDATNPSAPVPARAPTAWPIVDDADGIPRPKDPYRVDGMIGQEFFEHSSE